MITSTYTVEGTYGSDETPTSIFVCVDDYNNYWYCVEGSGTLNYTETEVSDGVNVETIADIDCMTISAPVTSETEMEKALLDEEG